MGHEPWACPIKVAPSSWVGVLGTSKEFSDPCSFPPPGRRRRRRPLPPPALPLPQDFTEFPVFSLHEARKRADLVSLGGSRRKDRIRTFFFPLSSCGRGFTQPTLGLCSHFILLGSGPLRKSDQLIWRQWDPSYWSFSWDSSHTVSLSTSSPSCLIS